MAFAYTYDIQTGIYNYKGTEYEVYTGEHDLHPMLANIVAWGEGDKTLQELYTDILVWEKKLTQKGDTVVTKVKLEPSNDWYQLQTNNKFTSKI